MREVLQLGWIVTRYQIDAFCAARGRNRLLEAWRLFVVALPCAVLVIGGVGGIVRGLLAGEELLPLILIVPLVLFGLATIFPLLGLMLDAHLALGRMDRRSAQGLRRPSNVLSTPSLSSRRG